MKSSLLTLSPSKLAPSKLAPSKLALAVGLFVSSLASPLMAHAEFRVAFLDVARVLNDSSQAKDQRKALDSRAKETKEKLESRRSELKSMEKSIREKGLGEDSKEVAQLRSQARAFEAMVRDAEDDVRKEYNKMNRSLSDKALKLVASFAQKNNLDLVLDKGEQGRGPVLYGEPKLDITQDILEAMND